MVEGLVKLLIERLQLYEKKMKTLPERILIYRDGVSEVCVHHYYGKICINVLAGPI